MEGKEGKGRWTRVEEVENEAGERGSFECGWIIRARAPSPGLSGTESSKTKIPSVRPLKNSRRTNRGNLGEKISLLAIESALVMDRYAQSRGLIIIKIEPNGYVRRIRLIGYVRRIRLIGYYVQRMCQ